MEILQNSILKLIIRQGADSDRKQIILDSGELGYTVDTNRLFVGDGFLSGGNITGNLFKGSTVSITDPSVYPSEKGDYVFESDTNKFYVLNTGNGSVSDDWLNVGGVYTSGDPHITITNDNILFLNPISAYYVSSDAVSTPISINSGKISLMALSSESFDVDAVESPISINNGRISLSPLSSGSIDNDAVESPLTVDNGKVSLLPLSAGNFSGDAVQSPIYISSGKIALSTLPLNLLPDTFITFGSGLDAFVGGDSYHDTPINPLSSNIVVESRQIHATYFGLSGDTIEYSRNLATVDRLSAGHYRFVYSFDIPYPNYIPIVQIIGTYPLWYQARVISTTLSTCDVVIINNLEETTDANMYLLINY